MEVFTAYPRFCQDFLVVDCLYLFGNPRWLLQFNSQPVLACFHRFPFPTKVTTVRWWMGHYNAPTPKRHWGASNSPLIRKIDKGVLQGWKIKSTSTPVVKYRDSQGREKYKGTKDLRKTEKLGWWINVGFVECFARWLFPPSIYNRNLSCQYLYGKMAQFWLSWCWVLSTLYRMCIYTPFNSLGSNALAQP